jgi:hypothetical protein
MSELSMKFRAYCLLGAELLGAGYGGYETVHRIVSSIERMAEEIARAGRDQIEQRREIREGLEKLLGLVQSIEAHQKRTDDGSRRR